MNAAARGRGFWPRTYKWDGENADFTPESNDIPWSFVPERKVTVEDVRYLLLPGDAL